MTSTFYGRPTFHSNPYLNLYRYQYLNPEPYLDQIASMEGKNGSLKASNWQNDQIDLPDRGVPRYTRGPLSQNTEPPDEKKFRPSVLSTQAFAVINGSR